MALATQRSVVDASSSEVPIVAAARAVGGNALAESVEDATSAENDLGTAIARTLDGGLGKSLDSAGSDSGLPSETVESCFAAVCALMNQVCSSVAFCFPPVSGRVYVAFMCTGVMLNLLSILYTDGSTKHASGGGADSGTTV